MYPLFSNLSLKIFVQQVQRGFSSKARFNVQLQRVSRSGYQWKSYQGGRVVFCLRIRRLFQIQERLLVSIGDQGSQPRRKYNSTQIRESRSSLREEVAPLWQFMLENYMFMHLIYSFLSGFYAICSKVCASLYLIELL